MYYDHYVTYEFASVCTNVQVFASGVAFGEDLGGGMHLLPSLRNFTFQSIEIIISQSQHFFS